VERCYDVYLATSLCWFDTNWRGLDKVIGYAAHIDLLYVTIVFLMVATSKIGSKHD
jgi:hypothetical protein